MTMDVTTPTSELASSAKLGFKFAFFKLIARDLERLVAFYTGAFGMEERNRIEGENFREVMLGTPGDAFTLVLFHYTDGRAVDIGSAYGPVGFLTRDLDAALDYTTAHGATTVRGPTDAGQMRVCFVIDPEGHEIELLQLIRRKD